MCVCTHHNNKNSFYCNYKRYFLFLKIHIPHHSSFDNLNISNASILQIQRQIWKQKKNFLKHQ